MKTIKLFILLFLGFQFSQAQFLEKLADKAVNAAERTVERRVEKEASKKTDEALDEVFEKDKKKNKKDKNKGKGKTETSSSDSNNSGSGTNRTVNRSSDFEPGNQILVFEKFEKDAMNDFPVNWNTNSSGKVVSLSETDEKWLELTSKGIFLMESISNLPENFTLEFDLYVSPSYSYYDSALEIALSNLNSKKEFHIWDKYKQNFAKEKRNGFLLNLHPQDAGSAKLGRSAYEVWEDGKVTTKNELARLKSFNTNDNLVKVQIWRQGQRIRIYVGDEKIWDLPRAFETGKKLNTFTLSRYESKDENKFYVSNIRLATSGEDVRSKLMKDGKYSTNAILFNSGSSQLKLESNSVIQEIATVLKENPTLGLMIVGHTDSDGEEKANLKLSKDRAESVKNALVKQFGISDSRLETDGKGELEPVSNNSSADGKAQNRRVEFLKM